MEIVIFPASFECIQRKLRENTKLYKLQTLDMSGVHGMMEMSQEQTTKSYGMLYCEFYKQVKNTLYIWLHAAYVTTHIYSTYIDT